MAPASAACFGRRPRCDDFIFIYTVCLVNIYACDFDLRVRETLFQVVPQVNNLREDIKFKLSKFKKKILNLHEQSTAFLCRNEAFLRTISRFPLKFYHPIAVGREIGSPDILPIDTTIRTLTGELARLETVLKENMSGPVSLLRESLANRAILLERSFYCYWCSGCWVLCEF